MKRVCALILTVSALFFVAGRVAGHDVFVLVDGGETVSLDQVIKDVKRADLVFVGELHDRKEHHRVQLDILKALRKSGRPVALGLEMFRADSQKELDQWTAGASGLRHFRSVYRDNWGISWDLYRDIFLYARKHRIPMIGLNVPQEITRKVASSGYSSLTRRETGKLPPGISCTVDRAYRDFIKSAYSAHRRDEKAFLYFCEAQMVWDNAMAWHLIAYKKKRPSATVVVLAGAGHSWKRGIPEQVKRHSQLSSKVILPYLSGRVEQNKISHQDADYIFSP